MSSHESKRHREAKPTKSAQHGATPSRRRALVRGSLAVTAGLAACAVIVVGLWTTAGGADRDSGDERLWQEIHRLRTEGDFAAARTLATEYLAGHPDLDGLRQRIHFELGMTFFDEDRSAEAVEALSRLVADYAESDLDPAAETFVIDDAQLHLGHALREQERFGEAVDAYQAVVDDWPVADRVPPAARLANAAVMTEELDDWIPRDGALSESGSDHSAVVERNLRAVLTHHAGREELPDIVYAALEYYRDRAKWNPDAAEIVGDKIRELCGWLEDEAPGHRLTAKATLILAEAVVYPEDSELAYAMIQSVANRARTSADDELLRLAVFKQGQCQRSMGLPAEARATWDSLREFDLSAEFAERIALGTASSYVDDGDFASALRAYSEMATDDSVRSDTRGVALFYQALMHLRLGQREEALAVFEEVREQHPGTMSATYASREIERRQEREGE